MEIMQKIVRQSGQFIKKNSPLILTIIGAVGVAATTVAAVKATPKALRLIEEAKEEKGEELTKFEVVKATAVCYIPAAIIFTATMACIFSANILSQKQQATLTGAYAMLDQSYKKYRAKVKELYGNDADGKVKCAVAKDELEKQNIVKSDNDKILFYDDYSGQYFESDMETVLKAEYLANRAIMTECICTLAEFYEYLGIPVTDDSYRYIGWTCDDLAEWTGTYWLDFHHEKTVMNDGLEATIIWYDADPTLGYISEYIDVPEEYKKKFEALECEMASR